MSEKSVVLRQDDGKKFAKKSLQKNDFNRKYRNSHYTLQGWLWSQTREGEDMGNYELCFLKSTGRESRSKVCSNLLHKAGILLVTWSSRKFFQILPRSNHQFGVWGKTIEGTPTWRR